MLSTGKLFPRGKCIAHRDFLKKGTSFFSAILSALLFPPLSFGTTEEVSTTPLSPSSISYVYVIPPNSVPRLARPLNGITLITVPPRRSLNSSTSMPVALPSDLTPSFSPCLDSQPVYRPNIVLTSYRPALRPVNSSPLLLGYSSTVKCASRRIWDFSLVDFPPSSIMP